MDQKEITADFLKNELQTGITFADFALTAKHDDRREQSQRAQGLRHRAPLHGHSLPHS
jgi:hypothetical protein